MRPISALAAVTLVAGLAVAAPAALEVPATWDRIEGNRLIEGTAMWRSADGRCSVATVETRAAAGLGAEELDQTLRTRLTSAGLEVADDAVGLAFRRGAAEGLAKLVRGDSDSSAATWHLQVCIHQKRDDHVCKPLCRGLLR